MVKQLTLEGLEIELNDGRARTTVRVADGTAQAGELTMMAGPSGAGKTTVLAHAAGLLPASHGYAIYNYEADSLSPVEASTRGLIAIAFQSPHLLGQLTVEQNLVMFGDREVAQSYLEMAGIGYTAQRPAATLSGGEAQRVAVVRALSSRPEIVIADEPFANLDRESAAAIGAMFDAFLDGGGLLLMASHQEIPMTHPPREIPVKSEVTR